ncbi:glycerophosphoryl diester phosphodiesterase protein [Salinisphaera shabanensis E1L3A]|uniref:glycerophosphodiester phosphodiesterase n=1 Tax=Salinisphaera shabanensis E1L3A TaxID=1033802 RepID=F7QA87_9GAMM|nr:glycerophosphodiester phosphodiesterase [Salinisphaera shabanensis]ERJ20359.1 glycerophosphoryl diester phosphodiesterase protein [Salinisphaera shabanensis E1L3A]
MVRVQATRALIGLAIMLATLPVVAAPGAEARHNEAGSLMTDNHKIVIAHRGASGYLPEHTLPAYAMAYALGADYIEPDVVMTADKRLICLHDIHLESTTDVKRQFPQRARADGRWYAADFTLEEIHQLNVTERTHPDGTRVFPGRFNADAQGFKVPTFVALVELVQSLNRESGRDVGIYPETKAPVFHDDENLPIERVLLDRLAEYGYAGRDAKIFIQSFGFDNLREMRETMGSDLPMIQLISEGPAYDDMVTPAGLDQVAQYADGIGPDKIRIAKTEGALVELAHERGLKVHPYTFRADQLPPGTDRLEDELGRYYFEYGVDGVFTDFTDIAVEVVHPDYRTRFHPR